MLQLKKNIRFSSNWKTSGVNAALFVDDGFLPYEILLQSPRDKNMVLEKGKPQWGTWVLKLMTHTRFLYRPLKCFHNFFRESSKLRQSTFRVQHLPLSTYCQNQSQTPLWWNSKCEVQSHQRSNLKTFSLGNILRHSNVSMLSEVDPETCGKFNLKNVSVFPTSFVLPSNAWCHFWAVPEEASNVTGGGWEFSQNERRVEIRTW